MRLAPDPGAQAWVATITGDEAQFDWDEWNLEKIRAKHNVEREEVHEIFRRTFIFGGRVVGRDVGESRWVVFGRTGRGRRLTLAFTRRGDLLRPISCRLMAREERKRYATEAADKDE
jgi:hypothetical protein